MIEIQEDTQLKEIIVMNKHSKVLDRFIELMDKFVAEASKGGDTEATILVAQLSFFKWVLKPLPKPEAKKMILLLYRIELLNIVQTEMLMEEMGLINE